MGKPIRFTVPALEQGLRARQIVQTVRSKTEFFRNEWSVGQAVDVLFRDEKLGEAEIVLVQPVKIAQLTEEDARLGGLAKVSDLKGVLKRFFRFFPDIEPIEVYKIRYRWKS